MRKSLVLLILVALVATACAPQSTQTATEAIIETPVAPTEAPPSDVPATPTAEVAAVESEPAAEEAPVEAEAAASIERPAIQTVALTNASTGETFTLADFAGKTVLVEPMATWCTNCRAQLGNVIQAKNRLDDNFVFVALSVGENISNADLANYAQRQGFDLVFAVASSEMLTELTNSFGRASLTPPSTPHFIIRPDGSMTELFTGAKNTDTLVSLLNEAAGA